MFKRVTIGGESTGGAMINEGFSPSTAATPKNLTETEGWKILAKNYYPDEKIARRIGEGLDATDKDERPDFNARHKYVDTALKVKNKCPAQQHHVEGRLLIGHLIKFVEHGTVPDMESREAGEVSPDALLKGVEDVESV